MNCNNLTDKQKDVIANAENTNISAFAVAGSGKTTVLVCTYLSIIDSLLKKYHDISSVLDKILVITFTDDASTEIKERIREKLEEKYDYIGPLNYISTIHSFANKILKNVSVKMGIDPDYRAGDEYLNMDLKNSTYREIINSLEKDEIDKLTEYLNPIRIGRNELSLNDIIFILYDKTKVMGWDLKTTVSKIRETSKDYQDENEANEYLIEPIIRIFTEFYNSLEMKKKRLGILSYDDILYYANQALNDDNIKEFKNFEYVIVDEYQDTSFIQQEIINKISGNSRQIFAGDFFQSIYEWRDATPVETIKNVKSGNFKQVEMNENFRSVPEIIDFVNELFIKIFSENLPMIKYIRIIPMEKEFNEGGVFIIKGEELIARERHKIEAENFAKAITYFLKNGKIREKDGSLRNVEMGDIAILFRSKYYMGFYADALRQRGIKFTFIDKENFFQTEEIKILVNVLDILNTSRWKKIKDFEVAEILSIVYGKDINSDNEENVADYLNDMRYLSNMLNLRKERIIIEFLKRTGYDVNVLKDSNGIQRYLNIYRFIDLLREIEDEKILPMSIFMEKLEGIMQNEKISALPTFELKENSVRLMTIHASKGLEFPIVFIADLQSEFRRNSENVYFDRELGIYIEIEELMNEKMGRRVEEEISRRRLQENLRILYVAFTRAKQYLIFSLPEKANEKEKNFSDFILKNMDSEKLMQYRKKALGIIKESENYYKKKETYAMMLLQIKKESVKLPYISATGIKEYAFCPRYYYLKKMVGNIDRNESMKFGEEFHAFMENADFEEGLWPEIFYDYIKFLKDTPFWEIVHDPENKIFREYSIKVKIDHTILNVRYDLLSLGKNSIIIDYKTGNEDDLDMLQMGIYAYAFLERFGRLPDKVILIYLRSGKYIEHAFSMEEISNTEKIIMETIKNIEEGIFSYKKRNCEKCNLRNICEKQN